MTDAGGTPNHNESTNMYENINIAKRINFERLEMLVTERIAALKLYVTNIDKERSGQEINDAICRDLVIPCVHTLATFIESVKVEVSETE